MTILALADDDGVRKELTTQPADLLISCGDVADLVILEAAKLAQCSTIFAVKGNHDSGGPFASPIVDLHLSVQMFNGLRFGGFNGSWRYKPRGRFLYEQEEVERLLADFPPVDVFVAHNSPRKIHERDDDVHVGFDAFNRYIERAQPRWFIHGHQHIDQETVLGQTRVVGLFGQRRFEFS